MHTLILDPQKQMTTPTSHLPHLIKLAQVVTTSTPTHAASAGWPLFADQGADSPLSEIETTESPAQSMNAEVDIILESLLLLYSATYKSFILVNIYYMKNIMTI